MQVVTFSHTLSFLFHNSALLSFTDGLIAENQLNSSPIEHNLYLHSRTLIIWTILLKLYLVRIIFSGHHFQNYLSF